MYDIAYEIPQNSLRKEMWWELWLWEMVPPRPEQSSNKNWELAYLTNNNARILILNWSVLPSAWLTWLGKTWEIRALTQPNRDTKMIKMRRRMGSLDLPLHFKKNEFSRWSASQCCRWQFRQNGINNKVKKTDFCKSTYTEPSLN